MKATLHQGRNAPNFCFELVDESGKSLTFVQTDWDYAPLARSCGWDMSEVQAESRTAHFERFAIELPSEAIADCSHQGACDDDVKHWAGEINRPERCTPQALAAELKEYGAWDTDQLTDDDANWGRIVWIAAGNLKEEKCDHNGTDGTIDCDKCGCKVSTFLSAAFDYLAAHDGDEFDVDDCYADLAE